MAGARRRLGAVVRSLPPEEQATLFAYFGRATTAYQESTQELIARRQG
ncbi:hypothetical protein [Kribbella qitaiheensis]|nr:hypothetical protein [Kribbella qitaiheensis]